MTSLTETAKAIARHLIRFSRTPSIASKKWTNRKGEERDLTLYWHPNCFRAGSRAKIRYVAYQHESTLTKAEAEQYLAWLDAGNVGRHYECQRQEAAQ